MYLRITDWSNNNVKFTLFCTWFKCYKTKILFWRWLRTTVQVVKMSVTVKNSAIQDLTLTHTIIIQIIFLLMKWLLGSFWLLFTDQFKTSTSPQAKKYNNKGRKSARSFKTFALYTYKRINKLLLKEQKRSVKNPEWHVYSHLNLAAWLSGLSITRR